MVYRSRLEWEGIPCRVLNENTAQVHNFYSQAIGGVQLQVPESKINDAKTILEEAGYVFKSETEWGLLNYLDKNTKNLPFIGNLRVELRGMIILVLFFIPFIVFSIGKGGISMEAYLSKYVWEIEDMQLNLDDLDSSTPGGFRHVAITPPQARNELYFREGNVLIVTDSYGSFDMNTMVGSDSLLMYHTQGNTIFDGMYAIELDEKDLTLTSKHITFVAHASFR